MKNVKYWRLAFDSYELGRLNDLVDEIDQTTLDHKNKRIIEKLSSIIKFNSEFYEVSEDNFVEYLMYLFGMRFDNMKTVSKTIFHFTHDTERYYVRYDEYINRLYLYKLASTPFYIDNFDPLTESYGSVARHFCMKCSKMIKE